MFSEFFIKRPVVTLVLSAVFVLMGVLGFSQLSMRSGPKIFRPSLHVNVSMPGASAAVIEESVVTPLENSLQNVSNISYMHSESDQDSGEIDLFFKDISEQQFVIAQSQVMQAVQSTDLPSSAQAPTIQSSGSSSNQIMFIAVGSSTMGQYQLVDYVANNIVKRLQQVQGVGVINQDSVTDALRINLNPTRMTSLNISVPQVISALQENDVSVSAGQIVNAQQLIPLNIISKPESVSDFENMIIDHQGDRLIRLHDIATVGIGQTLYAGAYTYYKKDQGVGIEIGATDDANPVTLGKSLRTVIAQINKSLPAGMAMHVVYDSSILIQAAIDDVFWTVFEAIVLVGVITFAFLGRLRFAFIPLVTIPICIISGFAFMWLFGFSINMVTLLSLVLAVGLVVDDAIVVLENSHRYIEQGLNSAEATIESMKHIIFPVIGMTISIIAVYVPVAFMNGQAAVYFQEFAFTLAGSVFISGIVALTLTPMMCARLLTQVQAHGYDEKLERLFNKLKTSYEMILNQVIRFRVIVIILFVVCLIAGYFLLRSIPSSLVPSEYAGYEIMTVQTADSASVAYTEQYHKQAIDKILKNPAVGDLMSFGGGGSNGSNVGFSFFKLSPEHSSDKETMRYAALFNQQFADFSPNAVVTVSPMNISLANNNGQGFDQSVIQFYVLGFAGYDTLSRLSDALTERLKTSPLFVKVTNGLTYSSQQYTLHVHQDALSDMNISMDTLTNTLSTMFGGYQLNNGYQFNGVDYPVIVQLPVNLMGDLTQLNSIFLKNKQNDAIPLSHFVTVTPTIDLPSRVHIDSARAGILFVTPKPNVAPSQTLAEIQRIADDVLPPGFSLSYPGSVQKMLEGQSRIIMMFVLGLVFIYLVLAALFESFIDPLIILLTVPLCMLGALLLLKYISGSLNIFSGIGLVTLIGLVAKHGVLIVRFANELCAEGQSLRVAIVQAAAIRLRPILMTTCTMTIGAVPLLFASGFGANARIQIGVVVIAGLLLGTLFSLFVVPVAYTLLSPLKRR